jgi:trimeric autotransporter adhesin
MSARDFVKRLQLLNFASRRRWATFFAISVTLVFLPSGETLGGSQPPSSLARASTDEHSGTQRATATGLSSLPPEAQSSISADLGHDIPSYQASVWQGRLEAENARNKLAANFTSRGVEVRSGSRHWGIALRGCGYGDTLSPVGVAVPKANFNRVEYRRGTLTEWYVNGPLGLEQGITLQKPPGRADGRPLTIALAMRGNLNAEVDEGGRGVTLTSGNGQAELHYGGLFAYDASGQKLPAWLEVKGTRLLLKADDTKARYPVVIDPFVQMAELTSSDGVPNDELGASVAIAGDTVVAGAPGCLGCGFTGAAYVYTKPVTGWVNMTQTAKLTASDGVTNNQFGFAVSISGATIVVGAHGDNGGRGAVYVFVEPAGGWANMTETAKLTASDSVARELVGRSVSISGTTVVAGAPGATIGGVKAQGAAYVFVEPANGWANMTETAKLTATGGVSYGQMGYSVGVDGNSVVAGAPSPIPTNSTSPGAAYVFVEPASGWANMTQTAQLTASDGVIGDRVGNFVAISGNTVVAGAPLATPGSKLQQGAAYVFVEPPSGWANMTQTAKLTSSDGVRRGYFGRSVAINSNEVVVGAPNQTVGLNVSEGAVYEYLEPASGWANMTETQELNAVNAGKGDVVGCRVGIDGATVVAGALGGSKRGAAFVFADTQ